MTNSTELNIMKLEVAIDNIDKLLAIYLTSEPTKLKEKTMNYLMPRLIDYIQEKINSLEND
jgi:hypothetical protein